MAWFLPSLVAVVVAACWHVLQSREVNKIEQQKNAVYVIGDLHGDAHCARYWVDRTGLVQDGLWTDSSSSLVFLGDYIDKGPTSRQTVEFVKSLTEAYPHFVTAIMGNHEMELLRDRDPEGNEWRWGGKGFFQLAYASAHPGEYLNFVDEPDELDDLVVEALYNASTEVYGYGHHNKIFLSPDNEEGQSILNYVKPELRAIVSERMERYQKKYLDAFRSGTELGTWLEQRPILAKVNDTLFVHGGISPDGARQIANSGVDRINQLFAVNAGEEKLSYFLDRTAEGNAIYDMVTYRGNHKPGACEQLSPLLPEGILRLGVGHTPASDVRISCNGRLLALDSSLGRWFRNSGNEYCNGKKQSVSSNGQYQCRKMNEQCQGQIIRIQNGEIEVIE